MKKTEKGKLLPEALKLARATSLEECYEKTKLPISWLRKFRSGKIESPSVQRVELMVKKLSGKTVTLL